MPHERQSEILLEEIGKMCAESPSGAQSLSRASEEQLESLEVELKYGPRRGIRALEEHQVALESLGTLSRPLINSIVADALKTIHLFALDNAEWLISLYKHTKAELLLTVLDNNQNFRLGPITNLCTLFEAGVPQQRYSAMESRILDDLLYSFRFASSGILRDDDHGDYLIRIDALAKQGDSEAAKVLKHIRTKMAQPVHSVQPKLTERLYRKIREPLEHAIDSIQARTDRSTDSMTVSTAVGIASPSRLTTRCVEPADANAKPKSYLGLRFSPEQFDHRKDRRNRKVHRDGRDKDVELSELQLLILKALHRGGPHGCAVDVLTSCWVTRGNDRPSDNTLQKAISDLRDMIMEPLGLDIPRKSQSDAVYRLLDASGAGAAEQKSAVLP